MSAQPPPAEWIKPGTKLGDQVRDFKSKVEGVMVHFPELEAISWWRDPMTNLREGGDTYSQHLVGLAMDLDWIGADLAYYEAAGKRGLSLGLSSVVYWTPRKTSIHFQYLPGPIKSDEPFGILVRPSTGTWYLDLAVIIWERLRSKEPTMTVKRD